MIEFKIDPDIDALKQAGKEFAAQKEVFLDALAEATIAEWKQSMQETQTRATDGLLRQQRGRYHFPSEEGHPPAVDYGNLINSLRWERADNARDFYGAEYGLYLNDSAQLNRPFIEPGLEEVKKKSDGIAKAIFK